MIKKITIKATNNQGPKEFQGRKGPYTKHRFSIQDETGKWYGSLLNDKELETVLQWKQGDQITIKEESREYNGKTYWDFRIPTETDLLVQDNRQLKLFYRWFMDEVATPEQRTSFGNFYNKHK